MNDILSKIKTNIIDKLPSNISKLLNESLELSEQGNYNESLKTLSECLFLLLREEYFIPAGLVYDDSMGLVEMIRELRNKGKDIGKTETDAILRIQEKAKQEDVDPIVMETCFEGAVTILEAYLREQGSKQQKKAEATSGRKSPGRLILRELDSLVEESDTEEKIQEHFSKLEVIYRDFPYDREVQKLYFQFLSHVDTEKAKTEILGYLESGDVTIQLGAVCITLLAEIGFMYEAMKKLDWYDEEYHDEKDRIYAELLVFMLSYLMEGKNRDKQTAEGLSDIIGQRKEPYYTYIENCYMIFSEREQDIRQKSEGLYLFKENQFRMKCIMRKEEDKKINTKKPEVKKEVEQKKVEPIRIVQERNSETPIFESSSSSSLDKTYTNSIGMEFVLIPAGEYMMGALPQDKETRDDEKPQHKVRITNSFFIGKYPVTQEEWEKLMGNNPSSFKEAGKTAPVEHVSWNDSLEFIKELNKIEVKSYRLPTETEWEYSARNIGSTGSLSGYTLYTYGDDTSLLGDYAWYDNNSGRTTHPVGQKKPNNLGLYDMMGNVWEWCGDWYEEDYYGKSEITDPIGSTSGKKKVLRGGSWISLARSCRLSNRFNGATDFKNGNIGFRLLRPFS